MTEQPPLYNSVAPLANVSRLTTLIKRIQHKDMNLPGMGCIYGRSGRGKTTAAVYACNSLNACHIEALPVGGVKELLATIVTELGVSPAKTPADLLKQACEKLGRTQRPLIIDEADYILTERQIEVVRRLHDISQVPVILMGEEALPQKLQRWERVHSRMLAWVGMEEATIEDVDHLARIYARDLALGPDLKRALLAASRGSLRNVSTNLSQVKEFAEVRGLRTIGMTEWGQADFHSGEAPQPRVAPTQRLATGAARRRGAA